jgi:hypothetical protein
MCAAGLGVYWSGVDRISGAGLEIGELGREMASPIGMT